jgi:hypothetical protein
MSYSHSLGPEARHLTRFLSTRHLFNALRIAFTREEALIRFLAYTYFQGDSVLETQQHGHCHSQLRLSLYSL